VRWRGPVPPRERHLQADMGQADRFRSDAVPPESNES